ncbi:MAG: hypothetical protein RR704_13455 [Stenotrophomonas sp.]
MRRMHFAMTLLSASVLLCANARADEDPDSEAQCEQIAPLMDGEDFKALDAMAEQLRDGARNRSGALKIARFYICMSRHIGTERQDVQHWNTWTEWAARWVKQSPRSPAAHIMSARVPLNLAWSYRGGGYSAEVGAQDWAPFREYTAVASDYLQANKAVAKRDPYWYEMAALIALREDGEPSRIMAVFDEGTQAFPAYDPLYLMVMANFTPHWHGDVQQMEDFAQRALLRAPKKQRAALYARMYWSATDSLPGQEVFQHSQVDWPLMRRGLEDITSQYPTDWNLLAATRYACLASDIPMLRKWSHGHLLSRGIEETAIQRYLTVPDETLRRTCPALGSFQG